MERPTIRRPTWHRPGLTPEGWRQLAARQLAQRANRTVSVRNERLPGRTVRYVPLYGNPLFNAYSLIQRWTARSRRR